MLLRTYEVRQGKTDYSQSEEGVVSESPPHKRRQRSNEGNNEQKSSSSPVIMARPCSEARGHTGYLTFARLKILS